jgi:hypothetical protein
MMNLFSVNFIDAHRPQGVPAFFRYDSSIR